MLQTILAEVDCSNGQPLFFVRFVVKRKISGQNLDENVLGAVFGFGFIFHIGKANAVYRFVIPLVEFFKAVFGRYLWHG